MRSGLYKLSKIFLFASIILLSHVTNIASKTLVEPNTGDRIIDLLDKIGNTLNENRAYVADIIEDDAYQITSPGSYILTKDIQGPLTIKSSDVWLNLNNYRVYDNTGTNAAIIVEDNGYDNITIYNGSVQGNNSPSGIMIGQGASLVKLDNINVTDCDIGILFNGTSTEIIKACIVKNCSLFENTKGIVGYYLIKTLFENCDARNCFEAGFELENSSYNIFYKCKALEITNNDAEKNAIGFSSQGGTANLFQKCIVEGISKSTSNAGYNAIGFFLTEPKTEIVDCIANVIHNILSANAYGIYLKASDFIPTKNDFFLYLLDTYNYFAPISKFTLFRPITVQWHKTGVYLALCGFTDPNNPEVRILGFNQNTGMLSVIPTATYEYNAPVWSLDWHPTGSYLAISGQINSDSEVRVLYFDQNTEILSGIPTATYEYGIDVLSVDWHPTGSYLAIGGVTNDPEVRILQFDQITQTLSLIPTATYEYGASVASVDWHPTGSYLAISGEVNSDSEVRILNFDQTTQTLSLIPTATYEYGFPVVTVDWHPTGNYLAICGDVNSNSEIRILHFDQITQTLSLIPTATYEYGAVVASVDWHPTGNYLAIGGAISGDSELRILNFDQNTQILSEIPTATYEYGGAVVSVDWSINGFLAIGGIKSLLLAEVQVLSFLKKISQSINCTIKNNEIANCSGTGIEGDGTKNMITKNISYNNATDYTGVGNTESMFETPPVNPYFNFFY